MVSVRIGIPLPPSLAKRLRALAATGATIGSLERNAALWIVGRALGDAALERKWIGRDLADPARVRELPYLAALGFLVGLETIGARYRDTFKRGLKAVQGRAAHTIEGLGAADDPLIAIGIACGAEAIGEAVPFEVPRQAMTPYGLVAQLAARWWDPAAAPRSLRATSSIEDAIERALDPELLEVEGTQAALAESLVTDQVEDPVLAILAVAASHRVGEGEPAGTADGGIIFISYSHEDHEWLRRLKVHLKPYERRALAVWDDQRIRSGANWRDEIRHALERTRIAVLLVSPDFLASDFIAKHELPKLLGVEKVRRVVWIPVRPSSFEATEIGKYQAAFDPRTTLAEMEDAQADRALVGVAAQIVEAYNSGA